MTQPTSVDMTFDTSLVDLGPHNHSESACQASLNTSFSTTISDLSDPGTTYASSMMPNQRPGDNPSQDANSQDTIKQAQYSVLSPTPVQHINTQDAYDQWASVYDSDGNMLQSIDDLELSTLLPDFLSTVVSTRPPTSTSIDLIDLGCGTGRNTEKLVLHPWPKTHSISVTGLDFSHGMLDIAGQKLSAAAGKGVELSLQQCECFPTVHNKTRSPMPEVQDIHPVDAVISTLVLEHVPLRDYFSTLALLVVKGGYALVTNMHDEMGKLSQAGFVNEKGVKVRGKSFAHGVAETVEEARKAGFQVQECKEREVQKEDVEKGVVGERGRKWIGVKVWYGVVLRKFV